jgi:Flp pilus assembly protein TadG
MAPLAERLRDQRGSIAVLIAIMLPVLLTLSAVTFSASYAYDKRNQLAAAADAAAKSGALEVRRDSSVSDSQLTLFGREEARRQGLNMAGSISVDVHKCTSGGATCTSPYNTSSYIEAIVSEPVTTFFGSLLPGSLTPRARAVAGTWYSPHCLVALAPTGGTASIRVGNAVINMTNCSVSAAGDIRGTNPNAEINAEGVSVAGTCTGTCGGFDNLSTSAPPPTDPLGYLTAPSNPGGCVAANGLSSISAGCYTSITVPTPTTTTMGPGVYYVTGTIAIGNNASLLGPSGVMLYLAPGASISFGNNVTLQLSAPTSGPYAGVAFYQDRANSNAIVINNNTTLDISGAFYAAAADFTIANSIGSGGGCLQFVVYRLQISNGNGLLDDSGCSAFGGSALKSVAMAE